MIPESRQRLPKGCRYSLKRQALLEQMAVSGADVIFLHGKAGYGKTELARQYAACFPGKVFWYILDESEDCPAQRGEYLKYLSDIREEVEGLPGIVEKAENFPTEQKERALLVLDSFEVIENDEILTAVRRLADRCSERLQLCILTRGPVPDFLSRFMMAGRGMVLEEAELAFTEEEERELARLITGGEADGAILSQLRQGLGGWPAGMMLALLYLQKNGIRAGRVDWPCLLKGSMAEGFLRSELFGRLPEEERSFLTQTVLMEEISGELCDHILKTDRSRILIDRLLEKGILCYCQTQAGVKIDFHRIIRLYMENCGDKKQARETARRAAEYALERKEFAKSAHQAARAGCTSLILQMLDQYGSEFLEKGETEALGCCVSYLEQAGLLAIGKVPERQIAARPEALGAAAQYYYRTGCYEKMECCLNQADSTFGKENKFSMYRGLYRGLLHFEEDREKNHRLIHNNLFLLEENHYPLPYLEQRERSLLDELKTVKAGAASGKLKVTFFGDFKAVAEQEGKAISWRTRKGGELFAYMVKLNGKPVGRKQLLSALWQDELPDNAVTMLHNMLYNLRKELALYQLEELIEYKDKVYRIHMEHIDTDLWEIDRLCRLVDQNDLEALLKNQDKFRTYWGRFLEDMDSSWAMEDREYYDVRYLKACTLLAGEALKKGRAGDGVIFYKNAMAVNSYSEELEAGLLKCYGASRNLRQVKTEYKRFVDYLKKELQAEPGEELQKLYRQILSAS